MEITPLPPMEDTKQKDLLSPFGEACSRMDLTAIHEMLEKVGYKDDEGATNEVSIYYEICRYALCDLKGVGRFHL